ncbi:Intersectin 1 (SH3 domain protein) [Geranomyces variabilis]|nr:Intersectin 1 (SH3 domain protein) [Geranomyces variabilis]
MSYQGYGQGHQGFPQQGPGGYQQHQQPFQQQQHYQQQQQQQQQQPQYQTGAYGMSGQSQPPAAQGQSLASQVSLAFIEQQDLAGYERYFQQAGPSPSGQLAANAARTFLLQSNVPSEILARIWSLCATSNPTFLTFAEFCVAMHLTKLAKGGIAVPPQLPETVVQQLTASNANLNRAAGLSQQGGQSGGPSAIPGHLANGGLVSMHSTGGSSYGSPAFLSPAHTGNTPMGAMGAPQSIQHRAAPSGAPSGRNSRSSSFAGVPTGVTVMHGFAGPLVAQAPIAPSVTGTNRNWAIDAVEKAQYDRIFKVWDPQNSGYIDGERARNIFSQSGIPDGLLMHIWNLADIQKHGKLNPDEFAVAMHLTYRKLNGEDLPQTLPPELIPPSTRELDSLSSFAKMQIMSDLATKKSRSGQNSPYGSTSSLFSSADPLGGFGASSPNLSDRRKQQEQRDAEEAKRKAVAASLEEKKRELVQIKEATSALNKTATQAQMDVDRLKRETRQSHEESSRVKGTRPAGGKDSGLGVSARAADINREIKFLLSDCRELVGTAADKKLKAARDGGGAPGAGSVPAVPAGGDSVQSKAAALLAARMAALGVGGAALSSPAATGSAAPAAASKAPVDTTKIEDERNRRIRELDAAADRVHIIMGKIQALAAAGNSGPASPRSGWEPPVQEKLKYEQGVGLKSKQVRSLIDELAKPAGAHFSPYSSGLSSPASAAPPSLGALPSLPYTSANIKSTGPSLGALSTTKPTVDIKSPSQSPAVLKAPAVSVSSPTPTYSGAPPPPPPPPPPPLTTSGGVISQSAGPAPSAISPSPKAPAPLNLSNETPSPGPTSPARSQAINDVFAQADAAIRAVRERQAAKLAAAGASAASPPTSPGAANPFSSAASSPKPAASTPVSSTAWSPTKAPAAQPAVAQEDEVEKAMRKLREQEKQLLGEDFRSGAGNVGAAVPVPKRNSIYATISPSPLSQHRKSMDADPAASPGAGAPSAMEKIHRREQEVLAEQKRIRDEQERRSRATPPSVPRRVSAIPAPARTPSVSQPGTPTIQKAIQLPDPPAPSATAAHSLPAVGGGPPPPPPPPPPGEVKPTKPWSSQAASVKTEEKSQRKKLSPVDVGARKSSLVMATGPVQTVGKVSDRIKNLQGGMTHIFGGSGSSDSQSHSESRHTPAPVSPLPASSISSGPESEWDMVDEAREREDQMSALPSSRFDLPTPNTSSGLHSNPRTPSSRAMKTLSDVFSDKFEFAGEISPEPVESQGGPLEVTPADPEGTLYKARAIYDYNSGGDAEHLDIVIGDLVDVVLEQGEWLRGTRDGKTGWFPRSHVNVVEEESPDPVARAPTPSMSPERAISYADALYRYTSQQSDEINLLEGDRLKVLEKEDADWWRVENERGETGLVPASYVEERSSLEPRSLIPSPTSRRPSAIPAWLGAMHADSNSSSAQSSFYDPTSGSATPTLPMKTKPYLLPKSTSFTIQSLGIGADDLHETETHSNAPSARTSLEDLSGDGHGHGSHKSSSFGAQASQPSTAWATKVDPYRIQSIPPDERKRQEAIYELIATEQSYVRDLESICNAFYIPMLSMIPSTAIASIFCNIEDIKLVNAVILSDFEQLQAEQGYIIDGIGDLFCRHADSLTVYQTYCGNFGNALKVLQKLRVENPRLGEFLKREQRHNPLCRSLDLSSFLLQPMQRITRYALLLKQILHYTPKAHPDHPAVVRALAMAEKEAQLVNSAARERESREKLQEIQKVLDLTCDEEHKLDLAAPTRVLGPRVFIYEGDVTKNKSGRKLHAYLFNDVLLLAQPKGKQERNIKGHLWGLYRKPMPLNEIIVRDSDKLGREPYPVDECCFQIVHGPVTITLRAPSVAAKRKWVNLLDDQYAQYNQAEKAKREGAVKDIKFAGAQPIGTLQVLIAQAKDLAGLSRNNKLEIFARVQLNRQQVKTRCVNSRTPHWNQNLVFSVCSLDEILKVSVYNYDRYTQDDYLGQAEIGLDFLEYYNEKETEPITLSLRDVPSGSVVLRLAYRKA